VLCKAVIPHRHAIADVDHAIDYYREHAGSLVAENFANEIVDAYQRLSRHPHIGSPRPSYDLDIFGVKSWSLRRFPHQIFYLVQQDLIELWRILHPKRDVSKTKLSRDSFQ